MTACQGDDDTLIVDHSMGFIPFDVDYDGGTNGPGGDVLEIDGGKGVGTYTPDATIPGDGVATVGAQTDATADLPPNAKPGECYARVLIPAVYERTTETVLKKEASERIEVVPARFEWVEERVLVKEASKKIEVVPPKYKLVEEKVMVTPASSRLEEVPAKYEWTEEKLLVKPAQTVKLGTPTEDDLKKTYESNKNRFVIPEFRKFQALLLTSEAAKAKLEEAGASVQIK